LRKAAFRAAFRFWLASAGACRVSTISLHLVRSAIGAPDWDVALDKSAPPRRRTRITASVGKALRPDGHPGLAAIEALFRHPPTRRTLITAWLISKGLLGGRPSILCMSNPASANVAPAFAGRTHRLFRAATSEAGLEVTQLHTRRWSLNAADRQQAGQAFDAVPSGQDNARSPQSISLAAFPSCRPGRCWASASPGLAWLV
jgi:hypothetical protein